MTDVEILQIQSLVSTGNIVWTEHASLRLRERGIRRNDLPDSDKWEIDFKTRKAGK